MADPMIDERLQAVEDKQAAAVQQVENTFGDMAQNADQYFNKQMQVTQDWADKQTELQNEQTALTLEQIEQQKEQAGKDYTKEQTGAWTDYQKQIAQHGVQAEQMAAAGMTGTGFSESSKVAAYTTYQNRVAAAKASFDQVVMNYNNSMKEARLQNSSVLAEISVNALQKGLELALQGFQYKNQLVTEGLGMKMDVENMYHGQYMDVWNQINTEKAQAEQIRQFEIQQENWKTEFDETQRVNDREYDYRVGRDKVEDSHWQAEYDRDNAALARQEALDRAQVMAAAGDFSGYKAALGLTDAQVKALESKYQSEIQTEADARAYEQKLDRAKVLAAGGDFFGYKELYDLTDEQVESLETEFAAGNSAPITKDGDTGTVDTAGNGTAPGTVTTPVQNEDDWLTATEKLFTEAEAGIDEVSLQKLGYGFASDEELFRLLERGILEGKIVNKKLVFTKGKNYIKNQGDNPNNRRGAGSGGAFDPQVRQ